MKNYEASWLMNTSMPGDRPTLTPWGEGTGDCGSVPSQTLPYVSLYLAGTDLFP